MAYATQTHASGLSLSDRFDALRARFAEARAKRAIYRETYAQLDDLSDRELADLGVYRSGIRRIALEAAGQA